MTGYARTLPSAQYDYRGNVGNLWENNVVLSLINWQATQFDQATPEYQCRKDEGSRFNWVEEVDHPLTELMNDPNPYWTRSQLMGATLLSLNVRGNAYWLKKRGAYGEVTELWWMPHWMIFPVWDNDGSTFISKYKYVVNGKSIFYSVDDIVHIPSGVINPANIRESIGPFSGCLREICAENEAGTFEAAALRNRGVPGVIISPKSDTGWDMTDTQQQALTTMYQNTFTGDGQARAWVMNSPLQVDIPAYKPNDMSLKDIRATAVTRICGAVGIDPMVISLPSDQKTYSNFKEALSAAWEHNILPTQKRIAEAIDKQLAPDFDSDYKKKRFYWNNTGVSALSENESDLFKRLSQGTGGSAFLSPNDARAQLGMDDIEGGDELVQRGQGFGGGDGSPDELNQQSTRDTANANKSYFRKLNIGKPD
jgi:HK97 family phage portal protein